jgi:hypothetical protein
MAIKPRKLKKDDLQPYYYAQAKDRAGNVIDLTGATIRCTMKLAGSTGTPKIDRRTTGIVVTDAVNGEFELQWQQGDTDTVGKYLIEFEIVPQSGGKFTLPPDNSAEVLIIASLDNQ